MKRTTWQLTFVAMIAGSMGATAGCKKSEATTAPVGEGVSSRRAADMIHAALAADREVYTKEIVQRLTKQQAVQVVLPTTGAPVPLEAREDWKTEHGKLPLPAQMFRMGAEKVLSADMGFSYLLLSDWPINKQNQPRSAAEKAGLAEMARTTSPHYGKETFEGQSYFVAIYPDVAVAEACVDCHNKHPDSPRRDFKVGDVMGGLVIRFRSAQ